MDKNSPQQPQQPSVEPEVEHASEEDEFDGAQFSSAGVITAEIAAEIANDAGGTFSFERVPATEVAADYGQLGSLPEEHEADNNEESSNEALVHAAGEEDSGERVMFASAERARVEQLAALQISQLEREYVSTVGSAAASSDGSLGTPEEEAAKAYAASLQAAGFDPTDSTLPSDPAQAKARKLAELKARLAASRAMRGAGGGAAMGGAGAGGSSQPMMELAPGSLDFPEDYSTLQIEDHKAFIEELEKEREKASVSSSSSSTSVPKEAKTVPLVPAEASKAGAAGGSAAAPKKELPAFDPFGLEKKKHNPAISLPQPKQPPRAVRAVSPLPEEKKKAIGEIMGRIQLKPRPGAGVSLFAEKAVEAALIKGKEAREAFDRQQKDKEGAAATAGGESKK
jgi:hypothetical protein